MAEQTMALASARRWRLTVTTEDGSPAALDVDDPRVTSITLPLGDLTFRLEPEQEQPHG